ncbi:MAG: hypothetical protein CME06_15810 [Gemmatimonadetes bacterium]|nr:hypothetical protein [Gemmatimonadota bacterium]
MRLPTSLRTLRIQLLLVAATAMPCCGAIGVRTISAGVDPPPLPPSGFSHERLDRVLTRHANSSGVDYQTLAMESGDLRAYAASLAASGPRTTPDRFTSRADRLAYYLNAYNALVLLGVVENWPIESVRDVRAPLAPGGGFGFFYGLRFNLDGDEINLNDLENEILRKGFEDARIHAAINCASVSCPTLQPRAWMPETLEPDLDRAVAELAGDARHVRIDSANRVVHLSSIYDWFREDFEKHAERAGKAPTVLGFIELYGGAPVAAAAQSAPGYEIRYMEYDWSINRHK